MAARESARMPAGDHFNSSANFNARPCCDLSHKPRNSLAQRPEQFRQRPVNRGSLLPKPPNNDIRRPIEPVDEKLIRMNGLNAPLRQRLGRKSRRFAVTINRAPQCAAAATTCLSLGSFRIAAIRFSYPLNPGFRKVSLQLAHQAGTLLWCQVPPTDQIPPHLLQDLIRPTGKILSRSFRESQQRIAQ